MTRHRTGRMTDAGMTLAEVVLASSILIVCLVSLSALLGGAISSSAMTRARDEATNLANNAIESARNLPYDQVGLKFADGSRGNPPGEILTPETSGRYTIATECTWVQAADGSTAYKKLKVTVSWASPIAGKVEVNTVIYGKTALSGVGDLLVQVSDRESPDPVTGQEVTFVAANGTTRAVTTDASGKALFGQVPVGPCTLSLVPPAGYIVDTTSLAATVSTDSASTAVIYIQKPAQVTVGVRDMNNAPLASTLVTIKRSDWSVGVTAYTDANGVVVFTNVLYGDYAATVSRDHYDYASATLPFTASPGAATPVVAFSMSPSLQHGVRVKVQDFNGTQISGAAVVLTQAGTTPVQAVTGSNGEFLFTPVPEGTYSVAVSKTGYTESSQTVTVHGDQDQETLTFSLSAVAAQGNMLIKTIEGQTPVNCALIVSGPNGYYSDTLRTGTSPNATGVLLLQNLVPGRYTVQKSGDKNNVPVDVTAGLTSPITLKN